MYGAGALPLKDPVKDYSGYTGTHKGLFGSVQLLVFRGPLSSVAAMVSMLELNMTADSTPRPTHNYYFRQRIRTG